MSRMNESSSTSKSLASNRGGWFALLTSLIAIICVWCILLPWVAAQPTMKQHLQFLDDRGIDPSAMFYTELDAMDDILDKIEKRR